MKKTFEWNPFADQPHNVAPKKERFRHHLTHLPSYFRLARSNLKIGIRIIRHYKKYLKEFGNKPVLIQKPFSLSYTPSQEKNQDILNCLTELNIEQSLIRIPSWERDHLDEYEKHIDFFIRSGQNVLISLLQQREDILSPSRWTGFLEDVFNKFGKKCSYFELGHAWNRTKWGVWNYEEYLQLARDAVPLAQDLGIKIIGPAVIDFEFHLYPPVLSEIPFEKITSLLYVDRTGAPENPQFGWDLPRKIALLKAIIDSSLHPKKDLWITEVNWPLKGTGKYSPAPGKSSVSESQQADYLVRYYIWCLTSGFIERIYWWQLSAPGYGLIDNRKNQWRKRPSYYAYKTLIRFLSQSLYESCTRDKQALIFFFKKNKDKFAVCWATQGCFSYSLPYEISHVFDRAGQEIPAKGSSIMLSGSPQYVFFK